MPSATPNPNMPTTVSPNSCTPNAQNRRRILVVDDGLGEREALARVLQMEHLDIRLAGGVEEAIQYLEDSIDLVISDLRMGTQTGIDLLRKWRARHPYTPFIILTAYAAVDSAVQAMKLGATDFLAKPVDPVELLRLLHNILERPASAAAEEAASRTGEIGISEKIIGRSPAMLTAYEQAMRAAKTDSTVLLLGESGTGKELFAEAVHRHSPRKNGPLITANMAAIPETLVESELFGHVRGAFTGAATDRTGLIEAAHRGTLFIDEIGDFPLQLQAKLLRALETRAITPLGSNSLRKIDVRIIAATSRDLIRMKDNGEFREDLYYRLNVIAVGLPPLRSRRQDIPLLVRHFLGHFVAGENRPPLMVAPELMRKLEGYDWPGNVRQLRNVLEWMSVMTRGDILTLRDLPAELAEPTAIETFIAGGRMASLKRTAMLDALAQFGGSRSRAAAFLGISVRTLQRKLREWELTDAADSS
jgi:DNA-binding NtrC family response regulator